MLAIKKSLNAIGIQYRSQILDWYLGWGSPGRLRFRRLVLWKLQSSKLQRSLLLLLGCLRLVGILLCQGLMVKLKFYLRCNGRNLFVKDFSDIIYCYTWDLWLVREFDTIVTYFWNSMVLNRQELKMQPFSESCFEDPQLPRLALQASQPCDTSRYGEGAFDSMLLPELYFNWRYSKVSRIEPIASTSTVRYKRPGPWTKLSMFLATHDYAQTRCNNLCCLFFPLGLSQRDIPGPYSYRQSPTAFTKLRARILRTDPISPTLCTLHDGTRPKPVSSTCMASILWPFGWQVLDSSNYPTKWDWGCLNCGAATQWQDFLSAVLNGLLFSFPTSEKTVNVGSLFNTSTQLSQLHYNLHNIFTYSSDQLHSQIHQWALFAQLAHCHIVT